MRVALAAVARRLVIQRSQRRRGRRPMAVFIGPVEIAGYYSRLTAALRGIGVDAVFVDLSDHRFRYESQHPTSRWVRAALWAERGSRAAGGAWTARATRRAWVQHELVEP